MRILLVLGTLALLGAATGVQEKAAAAPQETSSPAQKKLDEIVGRITKKRKEVNAAYKEATTDEEKQKILAGTPGMDFVPEFRAVAEEAKGTDTAAHAWMWVLQLGQSDKEGMKQAVQTMLEDHMDSDVLSELAGFLRYGSATLGEAVVVKSLSEMIEYSSSAKVKASALFTLGSIQMDSAGEPRRAEGRKNLERVVAEFAGVKSESGTYAESAARFLFALDNLKVGKAAPDFEATDENGVKWKLSDYRGKVVVVDFWGFW